MPPFSPRNNRMTIYDHMEAQGVFASNPANAGSMADDGAPLYRGPVQYPKMLFHPRGEMEVLVPARREPTPVGPVDIPAQKGLIYKVVQNEEEESRLKAEGWHDHPSDAIAAAPGFEGPVPLKSSDQRIKQLEDELARLQKLQAPEARPPLNKPGKEASAA